MGFEGLEVAYRQHSAELMRYATVLVGPADAHDVVTDAMVKVFAAVGEGGDSAVTELRAFLFRAVHHRAVDYLRSRSRRRRREVTYARRDHTTNSDSAVATDARALLAALTVQQRTVVFLTYWVDWSPSQIGGVMGVSEGTVRKQLARARARLREQLHE
ncbi:MAG: RNA polymerase sigma factor [Actinomycetota bacterium]